MNESEVQKVLAKARAIITGSHVVYTSWEHGTAYVNKDALYPHTVDMYYLCHEIAEQFRYSEDKVEVVIAPTIGGVILSQWVAYHLTKMDRHNREVLGVYAEKEAVAIPDPLNKGRKCYIETGNFVIKRGYDKLIAGKNVLVVEDVLTTGGSAKKVVEATRAIGGNVIGLGVLCNRGGITPQDVADVPKLTSLVNVKFDAWDEATCPLYEQNVPVNTEVGKGREFVSRKQA